MNTRAISMAVGALLLASAPHAQQSPFSRYLFVWTGDADRRDSDFLAVVDVDPASPAYGDVIRTVLAGERGTDPHHTEHAFTPGRPLFANGFGGNRVFRFDLEDPLAPRLLGVADAAATLNFVHSFERLPNGNVLATMQATDVQNTGPGGLVEYADDGSIVRMASAATPDLEHPHPYSMVILPDKDRVITSSARMVLPPWDDRRVLLAREAPGAHLQLWRLSDLRLLQTIALSAPPDTDVNVNPYELRRLSGGEVMVASGRGGLYRIRGSDADTFAADLVHDFKSTGNFVPVVVGNFWVQTLGQRKQVVALDVSDPSHPKEVSRVQFNDRQQPHWLAFDAIGNRIVVANAGDSESRLWMLRIDPQSGALAFDDSFRDRGSQRPGVSFEREIWPHGSTGPAIPHGSVFGR